MSESTDKKIGEIHDTVINVRLDLGKLEQVTQNTCDNLDKYTKATEKRLESVESDLGTRNPNDPSAFSQLQSHSESLNRICLGIRATWGVVLAAISAGAASFFGLFGDRR